jgi:hypothetical protein
MALVSSVYPPEIWSMESLLVLRDRLVMARLVHRNFENEVASKGDQVHTRKPVMMTAKAWAGQTGTDAGETIMVENPNAKNLTITLDTMIYTAFIMEDRDSSTSIKELREEFLVPAMVPIAQRVDDDIMTEYTSTASTDVNGSAISGIADDTVGGGTAIDTDDILAARKQLLTNQCPLDGEMSFVVCPKHEKELLATALFHQADQRGSTETLTNAILGRAFGFNFYTSQNVPDAVDTDTTEQSLAFHRNALALVTRPLDRVQDGYGAQSAYSSLDGLSVRVVSAYEPRHKGVTVSFDLLYGVQLLDSKLGVIVNP